MIPTFWILKVPQTLRFFVALRIQPHFHPIPKGDGLSRSGRAVNGFMFFSNFATEPILAGSIRFIIFTVYLTGDSENLARLERITFFKT
ncbi:hypothetical protein ACT7C9_01560 [Bacillus cereus]